MLLDLLWHACDAVHASPIISGALVALVILSLNVPYITQCWARLRFQWQMKNLRRLGVRKSNMVDQYDPRYGDTGEPTAGHRTVRIKAIFIHPVKSCGPIELDYARLTKPGLLYDRSFALAIQDSKPTGADESPKWRFISQRTKPTMSQIETELWLPQEGSDPGNVMVQSGGCLVMRFRTAGAMPSGPVSRLLSCFTTSKWTDHTIIVPLNPTPTFIAQEELHTETFTIHYRDAQGLNMGALASVATAVPHLKQFLNIPPHQKLTLFRCTPDTLARTDRNLAPLANIGTAAVHGYTDQQPVNINSLSSVHAVSKLLPPENQPLNALRFRANIWISGAAAYDEESWKRFRVVRKGSGRGMVHGNAITPTMSVVCRTSRCTMPNVDPKTGCFSTSFPDSDSGKKRGKPQPSTSLVEHRTVENGNKMALGYIGMHCVPEDWNLQQVSEGEDLVFRVGDEIEVLERGEHLYGSTGNDY